MAKTPTSSAETQLADGQRRQQAAVDETTRLTTQSTPTPTQEENDKAKLGLLEGDAPLQDDGSGPDTVGGAAIGADTADGGDGDDAEKVDRRRREYRTRVSESS